MTELEGWNYIALKTVGSTNDEAKKYCLGFQQKNVIRADKQTAGRGRRGRTWISDLGNLFFSLSFEFDLKNVGALVMTSALSLAQAVEKYSSNIKPQLKWPNDVLLNGKKMSGILLEKGDGNYVIVGIGVNVVSAPENENLLYQATSLRENGIVCTSEEFLGAYLREFNQNLELVENNKQSNLQAEWLNRAYGLGQSIIVRRENEEEKGIFSGIDENMALLLKQDEKIKRILVGDIFFDNGEKNERI